MSFTIFDLLDKLMQMPCPNCSSLQSPELERCSDCGSLLRDMFATEPTKVLNCPKDDELVDLVGGRISDDTRVNSLEQHLSTCRICKQRLQVLRSAIPDDSATSRQPTQILEGESIAGYKILGKLGEGAFGVVFRAQKGSAGRPVALKLLKHRHSVANSISPERWAQHVALFEQEGAILERLSHPNIVPVVDVGETEDGLCFIASELIDGPNLRERIGDGLLSVEEATRTVALIARGLDQAHKQGIVHRDVKPANILLDKEGMPYITDFGLVLADEDYGQQHARGGGTVAYMSPEQTRGEGHLADSRTDVFSLGVVLYELLTGVRPFPGSSPQEILDQIQRLDPRPVRMKRVEVSPELDRICMKALAKSPADRYATAIDMANDLLSLGQLQHLRQVNQLAADWDENSRAAKFLIDGPRLKELVSSSAESSVLSLRETAYLNAAVRRRRLQTLRTVVLRCVAITALAVVTMWTWWVYQSWQIKYRISESRKQLLQHKPTAAIHNALEAVTLSREYNSNQLNDARSALVSAMSQIGGIPFGTHQGVTCLEVSDDGDWLVSGGDDGVRLWRVVDWSPSATLESKRLSQDDGVGSKDDSIPPTCVGISNDGEWIASGDAKGVVRIWRCDSKHPPSVWVTQPQSDIQQLEFCNKRWLVWRTTRGVCKLDLQTLKPNVKPDFVSLTSEVTVLRIHVASTTQQVAIGLLDGGVELHSLQSGKAVSLDQLRMVYDVRFDPHGRWLAASCAQGVGVWDQSKGNSFQLIQTPKAVIAFDPFVADVLVVADENGAVVRYDLNRLDLAEGRLLDSVQLGAAVQSLTFCRAPALGMNANQPELGRRILALTNGVPADQVTAESSHAANIIRSFRVAERSERTSSTPWLESSLDWVGHDHPITSFAVADHYAFSAATADGAIRRWDLSAESVNHYPMQLDGNAVALNPEETKLVVTGGSQDRGWIYDWPAKQLLSIDGFLQRRSAATSVDYQGVPADIRWWQRGVAVLDRTRNEVCFVDLSNGKGKPNKSVLLAAGSVHWRAFDLDGSGGLFVKSEVSAQSKAETTIRFWQPDDVARAIETKTTLGEAHSEIRFPAPMANFLMKVSPSGKYIAAPGFQKLIVARLQNDEFTIQQDLSIPLLHTNSLAFLPESKDIERETQKLDVAGSLGTDDQLLAVADFSGLEFWSLPNGTQLHHSLQGIFGSIQFLGRNEIATVGDINGEIHSHRLDTMLLSFEQSSVRQSSTYIGKHPGLRRSMTATIDGRFLINSSDDGRSQVFMLRIQDLEQLADRLLDASSIAHRTR